MSIDTLKQDLAQVISSIPQGPLATTADVADYLRNNLVPFVSNVVDEISEVDDCVAALVDGSEDILHEDSGEVFAGLIESGKVLVGELRIRVGGDKRVLGLIRAYEILAANGLRILADIVVPDDEPDPEDTSLDADKDEPKQDGAE